MGITTERQTRDRPRPELEMAPKIKTNNGREVQASTVQEAEKAYKGEGILLFFEVTKIGKQIKKTGGGVLVEYNTLSHILKTFKMSAKGKSHLAAMAKKRQAGAEKHRAKQPKKSKGEKKSQPKKEGKSGAAKPAKSGGKKTMGALRADVKKGAKKPSKSPKNSPGKRKSGARKSKK